MELELKHLAPYLPYKLKVVEWYRGKQIHDEFIVDYVNWNGNNIGGSNASLDSFELERAFNLRDVKPILRPMSSMTKEEAYDLLSIVVFDCKLGKDDIEQLILEVNGDNVDIKHVFKERTCYDTEFSLYIRGDSIMHTHTVNGREEPLMFGYNAYAYLFSKHFDVFGLIEQGLAIEK